MARLIFIVSLFLFAAFSLRAQTRWNYSYTDSVTFALYNAGKFVQVIDSSSAAIKDGTDFYYLRMRRGISFYSLQQFGNAIPEFEHALKFFPADSIARKYLYWSELENGWRNEARWDGKQFSAHEKKSLGYSNPVATQVGAWVGYSTFNTSGLQAGMGELPQTSIYKNLYYADVFFKNRIGQRFELGTEVAFLHFTQLEQFPPAPQQTSGQRPSPPTQFQVSGTQPGFSISGKFLVTRKFSLSGSALYNQTSSTSHELLQPYAFKEQQHSITLLDYGIAAAYHFRKFDASAHGYFLQSSDTGNIFQSSLLVTWYPHANLDFYLKGNFSGVIIHSQMRPVMSLLIGKKAGPHVWVDGEFLFGNLKYYTAPENNILYNMADETSWRLSATLHVFAKNHLLVDFQYAYTARYSGELLYSQANAPVNSTFYYHSNQLTLSTSWKF